VLLASRGEMSVRVRSLSCMCQLVRVCTNGRTYIELLCQLGMRLEEDGRSGVGSGCGEPGKGSVVMLKRKRRWMPGVRGS
jgi:hypothetical protein